jgi:Thioredoxin
MKELLQNALKNALSYKEYITLIENLAKENKSTGHTQTEDLWHYSTLNLSRMSRLNKTIKIPEEIKIALENITKKQTWIVLTEGWCGDAAQIIPIIHKMAQENCQITLRLVLRDENDALMQEFLTNGGRAIPILIILDENFEVQNHWGPRPKDAKNIILDYKAKHGIVDESAKIDLQKWYFSDKGISTMQEIMALI